MNTVGTILKAKRLEKRLSLEYIEQQTKIRKKFLMAIESDDYSLIPSQSYAKGFIKNYSEFLGLNSVKIMAFFRRQTKDISKSSLLPKGMAAQLNESIVQMTPRRFIVSVVGILVTLFMAYFVIQYKRLQDPPWIAIESPIDRQTVTGERIDVFGKTDADATLTINGISVLVRADGQFFDQVYLVPGANKIVFTVTSRFGKTAELERTVILETGK